MKTKKIKKWWDSLTQVQINNYIDKYLPDYQGGLTFQNKKLIYLIKKAKFPNGFTNWIETFAEIWEFIVLARNSDVDLTGKMAEVQKTQGTGGFYELAEDWTREFEARNFEREWDGEFFDELEEFCRTKNNQS